MGSRQYFQCLWYSRHIEATADNPQSDRWRIDLLGVLRARCGDRTIERFPTQKTAALLALLAFYPHRRHSREEIADLLWPDADLPAARDRLSQSLVWLRRHLEPPGTPLTGVLLADRSSVRLNPDAITTDVAEFESLLTATDNLSFQRTRLERAVSLYQGDLLPGNYSDWVLTERQRFRDAWLLILHRLTHQYEDEGLYDDALQSARRALAADPLREEAHTDLMRVLAAKGEAAAALRQFQELKRLLAQEFGSEPSPASRALAEKIQRPSVPSDPLALRETVPGRTALLPAPLTRFFGRDAEMERIEEIIQPGRTRLVTLIGIGGAGKTRLSLAVAARLVPVYDGAVVFAPLADLEMVRMIPAVIAAALRLPEAAIAAAASSLTPIVEALSARPFLLILDNVEHILAEVSPLVRELLERVPALTILTTSRQRLGIEGEQEVGIAALPESVSISLFVDRSRLARPDFVLTDANAASVAGICARLEGIPLAIELCAAWAQVLTPSQMLEKLERRFDLLVSRRTDITPRHRTLRAALEYSYLQLSTPLQRLFSRLSVFRGGWSLEAAQAVGVESGDADILTVLADITELRERSLVTAEEMDSGDGRVEMRYRLLETLREFAGEQLTYADRAFRRRSHAEFFVQQAERAESAPAGREQEKWLSRLEQEQDNLRTALAWCLELQEAELGLRLGGALRRYWSLRGRLEEGYRTLHSIFDLTPEGNGDTAIAEPIRAKAWNTLGYLAWAQGNYGTAHQAHQKALSLYRHIQDKAGIGESLYYLGITSYRQDDYPTAQTFFDESLTIARERDDEAGIARVLLNLGNIAYEQTRYDEAESFFQQSLEREQKLGNRQRIANALSNIGLIAMARKEYDRASDLFLQALTISRELADSFSTANFIMNLGTAARYQEKSAYSWSLLMEGMKLAYEIGNKHILSHYLLQLGLLESGREKSVRSVILLAAARQVIENLAEGQGIAPPRNADLAMDRAREELGEVKFNEIAGQTRARTLEQIVTGVLAWEFDAEVVIPSS